MNFLCKTPHLEFSLLPARDTSPGARNWTGKRGTEHRACPCRASTAQAICIAARNEPPGRSVGMSGRDLGMRRQVAGKPAVSFRTIYDRLDRLHPEIGP
jgi:hypothetical protein